MTAKILLALSLLAQQPVDISDASYYYANVLYEDEDAELRALAVDEYKAYLRTWPQGRFADDARYRIGKLYERFGSPKRAVLWYMQLPLQRC